MMLAQKAAALAQPAADTIDLRRPDRYGRDPRTAPASLTQNATKIAALEAASTDGPTAKAASARITALTTMADFEAALELSRESGRMVIIKFYAPWCTACKSIKLKYQSTAKRRAAVGTVCAGPLLNSLRRPPTHHILAQSIPMCAYDAQFYECDFAASRVLCALCGIAGMPAAHIYAHGELQETLGLTGKDAYDEFVKALDRHGA